MGTRVKGFFKGLKNISNIFDDDDEEEEIQIGMPTDVKHVAHIGADGPAVESPSWMKEFDGGKRQSMGESPHVQKGTNNNHRISRSEELPRDPPEKPKTHRHRHHRSIDSDSDSQSSTRTKNTRRHRIRRSKDKGEESKLPDIPKRSRRKKPKDDDVSVKSTQSHDTASSCSEAPSDL